MKNAVNHGSAETKTHWKKLTNPNYIGAYAFLPGEEKTVQITKVTREIVTGPDGKQDECTVAYLKGEKPVILNNTNADTVTKVVGSPYIEDWCGKWITLYVERVRAFGQTVDAVRVKPVAPKITLPDLNPSNPKWDGARKSVLSGQVTVDQIRKKYTLTKENEALLTAPEA